MLVRATADGGSGVWHREAPAAPGPTRATEPTRASPGEPAPAGPGRRDRPLWLVALVPLTAWVAMLAPIPGTLLPLAWPAAGILAGLVLGTPAAQRRLVLGVGVVGIVVALLAHGVEPPVAVSFALASGLAVVVARRVLVRGEPDRRPALLDDGDVNRMISAVALGSLAGGVAYASILAVVGAERSLLGVLAFTGAHAASLMVVLPLFMRLPRFPPAAPRGERVTQWVVALGTTAVVTASQTPPLLFIVMPTFAWLGFRGTLRETTWVLVGVGALTTTITALGHGAVATLGARYDLAPELAAGYLQLFLLDCGLVLLPLSVAAALHRSAAAEAAAGRDTLERLLASATATAIMATDADGRIVVFNPGAETMFGYPTEEVVGGLPDRFHPPGELRRLAEVHGTAADFVHVCTAVARSAQPRRLWAFQRRDGSTGTMLMTAARLPAGPGGRDGLLCTAEDVTEREQAQAALVATLEHREAAVTRLEELDRIRSDFVSTVSHELRTPITTIIGFSEMLQESGADELSGAHRAAAHRISRNGRRLLDLIEDLLTISQVQASELAAEMDACDLRDPVAGAVRATSEARAGRDLRLDVALPEDPVPFVGDHGQLERLLHNLLTNAIKFTLDGGTVEVGLVPVDTGVEVVVRDNGVGIPAAEQDQLFTRFFRSSTSAAMAVQGTGLGLTIVQAIAGLHGGEARIDSTEGVGTTVTVWLPHPGRRAAVPGPGEPGHALRT